MVTAPLLTVRSSRSAESAADSLPDDQEPLTIALIQKVKSISRHKNISKNGTKIVSNRKKQDRH